MGLIYPVTSTSVLYLGSLLMNINGHQFISTGCQSFSSSVWRECEGLCGRSSRPQATFAPSSLGSVGLGGGLAPGLGALWPTQWQRVQATSPASLRQPPGFSEAIRAWASFCSWQRGCGHGCEQSFLSERSAALV